MMKETSLSFNRYFTHGNPSFLFSWCFTVRSPCFYIQTQQFLLHTPTQAVLIINLSNYSLTAHNIVHVIVSISYTCVQICFCVCLCVCLCPSVRLLFEPQGTFAVQYNVPRGSTLLAAPPRGGECRWWGQGNQGTFPVEMGLSLHQLLLQLQREACRSLGTRPIGTQMGIREEMHTHKIISKEKC